MNAALRRCFAALLAVMLVSTAAAPVGMASAQQIDSGTCSNAELVFIGATLGVGSLITDCELGIDGVDPAEYEEAQQVHSELYSQALGQASQSEVLGTTMNNYLQETTTISKMEGKNRFIRSLENDSTQSQAVADARDATLDYYAGRQDSLLASFETQVMSLERIYSSAESEANLSTTDVMLVNSTDPDGSNPDGSGITDLSVSNETVQLVNGSSRTVMTLEGQSYDGVTYDITPDDGGTLGNGAPYQWIAVTAPSSQASGGSTPVKMLNGTKWTTLWAEVDTQGIEQANEVEDFADSTYDQWSSGLINSSDLVDPYLGAREYSPTDGSEWSERTLSSIGILPPDQAEDLRSMKIVDETTGIAYEGTLMSDGNPSATDGFVVGETYNASKIPGKQFVATADGPEELTKKFTVANASGFEDGKSYSEGDLIRYSNPDYQTADLEEFKNLSHQIMQIRADLETRERKIENASSSGGSSLLEGRSAYAGAVLVVLIVAALLYAGREQDSVNIVERQR